MCLCGVIMYTNGHLMVPLMVSLYLHSSAASTPSRCLSVRSQSGWGAPDACGGPQ